MAQFEQFEAERFDLPEHAEHSRAVREQAGLYKGESMSADRGQLLPIIDELADRLEPEHGIAPHRTRKRDFAQEVKAFMEVYNLAWSHNWAFVPLTDAELDSMAKELKPVLDEDFACVARTADD